MSFCRKFQIRISCITFIEKRNLSKLERKHYIKLLKLKVTDINKIIFFFLLYSGASCLVNNNCIKLFSTVYLTKYNLKKITRN